MLRLHDNNDIVGKVCWYNRRAQRELNSALRSMPQPAASGWGNFLIGAILLAKLLLGGRFRYWLPARITEVILRQATKYIPRFNASTPTNLINL